MDPEKNAALEANQKVSGIIKWNEVTWYSKLVTLILFLIILPLFCFYIGTEYQKINSIKYNPEVSPKPVQNAAETKRDTSEKESFITETELTNLAPFKYAVNMTASTSFNYVPKASYGNWNNIGTCLTQNSICREMSLNGTSYTFEDYHVKNAEGNKSNYPDFKFDLQYENLLTARGFTDILEVGKGFQYGKHYQYMQGDKSQVVQISAVPINLTFPEDGGYPESDGVRYEINVSDVFEID